MATPITNLHTGASVAPTTVPASGYTPPPQVVQGGLTQTSTTGGGGNLFPGYMGPMPPPASQPISGGLGVDGVGNQTLNGNGTDGATIVNWQKKAAMSAIMGGLIWGGLFGILKSKPIWPIGYAAIANLYVHQQAKQKTGQGKIYPQYLIPSLASTAGAYMVGKQISKKRKK